MSRVVILDNGGGLCKAGFGGDRDPAVVVPNCLGRPTSSKKWLVADQLLSPDADVTSVSLRRPFDRGYLINPDLQKEIWDRILRSLLHADPSSSTLLLVEPLFNPSSIQRATDELVFEDFGFQSLFVGDSPSLVHLYEASRRPPHGLAARAQCSLVVDSGFSFTHAAPVVQNFTLNYGVRRMDLGGKALTNYLKELVSYRSINVMDETLLIDDAKEKLCFVSLDVDHDLQLARKSGKDNPYKCTYVLPDGITHTKGFVKDMDEAQRFLSYSDGGSTMSEMQAEDVLVDTNKAVERKKIDMNKSEFNLTNERFLVPEMLFCPADLGMNQAGLAECIVRAVHACHPYLHPVLFESIILTGGSTLFPRFAERLERELRPLVCGDYRVKIACQEDPIKGVWRGGSLLASSPDFESMCITKSEYEEMGSTRCRRRFFH
ncbi:Actin-related protein 6 [Apostasia shenzhenica]|uniref:Actin-related protein 6 n=1 Tax=Apostasia shenzhenica TaxID=1088818 RepID=A0A2I0BA57_9ASPA|nr:Actin-related protein 6 [Apostasia shenzhenica]